MWSNLRVPVIKRAAAWSCNFKILKRTIISRSSSLGDQTFAAAWPRLWNGFSTHIRQQDLTLDSFNNNWKDISFFPAPVPSNCCFGSVGIHFHAILSNLQYSGNFPFHIICISFNVLTLLVEEKEGQHSDWVHKNLLQLC